MSDVTISAVGSEIIISDSIKTLYCCHIILTIERARELKDDFSMAIESAIKYEKEYALVEKETRR